MARPSRLAEFLHFQYAGLTLDGDFKFETLAALDVGAVEIGGDEDGERGSLSIGFHDDAEDAAFIGAPVIEPFFDDAFDAVGVIAQGVRILQIFMHAQFRDAGIAIVGFATQYEVAADGDEGNGAGDGQKVKGIDGGLGAACHL